MATPCPPDHTSGPGAGACVRPPRRAPTVQAFGARSETSGNLQRVPSRTYQHNTCWPVLWVPTRSSALEVAKPGPAVQLPHSEDGLEPAELLQLGGVDPVRVPGVGATVVVPELGIAPALLLPGLDALHHR